MAKIQIDDTDRKILSYLVKDARMAFLEIARLCGISGAAIHQRVKRLENSGIITGSRLMVKPEALGMNICAFIAISLSEGNKYPLVIESLRQIPEVVECHFVTGKHALLVKIYCLSDEHLMELIINTFQKIPYIQSTETLISLQQPIERQIWVKEFENTKLNMDPATKPSTKKASPKKSSAKKADKR